MRHAVNTPEQFTVWLAEHLGNVCYSRAPQPLGTTADDPRWG